MYSLRSLLVATLVVCAARAMPSPSTSGDESDSPNHPFVITIKPESAEPFKLTVEPSDTVADLKRMISLHENGKLPVEQQQLGPNGGDMFGEEADGQSLSSLKIGHDSVLQLVGKEPERPTSRPTYFGVDADDHEAVKQRQKELGHEQFRKMFGNDFDPDHINWHESSNEQGGKLHEKIHKAFEWLFNVVTGKRKELPGEPQPPPPPQSPK